MRMPKPVHVLGVFLAEHLGQLRVHQVMLQAVEHGGFEMVAADGVLVRTGAFVPGIGAADADLVPDDGAAAAFAALHQTGERYLGRRRSPQLLFGIF